MSLHDIRSQIDAIDDEILHLLADRVALARKTRSFKGSARDPKREEEIHDTWHQKADELDLDPEKTDVILQGVIDLSRSVQKP